MPRSDRSPEIRTKPRNQNHRDEEDTHSLGEEDDFCSLSLKKRVGVRSLSPKTTIGACSLKTMVPKY
ncbi:unnamed protein product [Prunus armeniaca]|uniref:Uncharacterized protein n=1 Tax=Prunus armeniaca TaxID=36596 RepID=A0A6J5VXW9_PRUAR|nr:unnamed protein product [Prunus armeniaca]CAB4292305.1 unnamed protein product [Prunus armeniaca]